MLCIAIDVSDSIGLDAFVDARTVAVAHRLPERSAPIFFIRAGAKLAMNSFEMNKILSAVLGTCLGVVALDIAAGTIFAPEQPAKPIELTIARDRSDRNP